MRRRSGVAAQLVLQPLDGWGDRGRRGIFVGNRELGAAIRNDRFVTSDGTTLAWYEDGRADGPPVVLCNGLGGGTRIWRSLVERLASTFRVLSWDYRGLYGSDPSANERYDVAQHADDLAALVRHSGADRPFLIGWSMGVQVALELHRDHAAIPRGLVALHGAAAHPIKSAFDSSTLWSISPAVYAALRALGRGLDPHAQRLARSPLVAGGFVVLAKRLGFMGPGLDFAAFQDIAEDWLKLDLAVYAEMFEQLDRHDASDLLPAIHTPTLVIAGERDRFTPPQLARDLAEALPNARIEHIRGATHFGLMETPSEISDHVIRFLSEGLEHLTRRPISGPGSGIRRRSGAGPVRGVVFASRRA